MSGLKGLLSKKDKGHEDSTQTLDPQTQALVKSLEASPKLTNESLDPGCTLGTVCQWSIVF
jgi:hypothetical protein